MNAVILGILRERIRAIPPIDAGHDFSHIERVVRYACDLYKKEIFSRESRALTVEELEVCECAALLHDCVPVAKDSPLRSQSSKLSSEKAREWLLELGWTISSDSTFSLTMICEAIEDHSYSAGLKSGHAPRSLLGECLQDADRLEALGAMGLYRTIATGVSMGTVLFDAIDPWAKNRELDDKKFTIDHFFIKLLKLPESFRTASARGEAEKRAQFLRDFLNQLKHEIN